MTPVEPIRVNGAGSPTAIDWPTVRVGAITVTLKYSFAVMYKISKAGIDLKHAVPSDPQNLATYLEVFAVMAGWTFVAAGQVPPSAEWWAEQVAALPDPLEVYTAIARGVNEAFAKAPLTKQIPPVKPANQEENSGQTEASEKTN